MEKCKQVFIVLLGLLYTLSSFSRGQNRPNLVVIMVDQFRGQALGIEGKEPVHTPNLDALAKSGLTFTQMISNHPLCSPARAMFMTGCYSINKTKVYSNANSATAPYGVELPQNATCWSDVLYANGYSTGYIGKWHLDSPHRPFIPTSNNTDTFAWNEWTPPAKRHGFAYWYSYGTYDEHLRPMYWDTKAARNDFHYIDEWGPQHDADKAISFLKNENNSFRDDSKPFALMVSINPPHSPYNQVPQRYQEKYKNVPIEQLTKDPNIPHRNTKMGKEYYDNIKNYYAMIYGVDEQIGRILDCLKKCDLVNNTIIVFVSDHGNCLGKHNEISKNNMYEESLRVPLIISWNGHIQPRLDKTALTNMPDIYPTILGLMGLGNKIPIEVEGNNLAPFLLTKVLAPSADQFFMATLKRDNPNSGLRGVRNNRYKLVYNKPAGKTKGYFFDLKKDPFELKNIYSANNAEVIKMKTSLITWLKKTNDPFRL